MTTPTYSFPFSSVRASLDGGSRIEDRRSIESSLSTPPAVFASLQACSTHIKAMQPTPEPTIVVNGESLPASPGFGAKVVFRNA